MEKEKKPEHRYPDVGVYEHYKSAPEDRRYYQVLGIARHTETDEVLAVYIPLYVIPEHTGLRLQARPLDMFTESVEHNGQEMPRFRYVGSDL